MRLTSCCRIVVSTGATILLAASASPAQAVSIDFEDGSNGASVGAFYAPRGALMRNGEWSDRWIGRPGVSGVRTLSHAVRGFFPKASDPIVLEFAIPLASVAIDAIDVGFNDARVDAYDAVTGGSLLGSDVYVGRSPLGNTGTAADTGRLSVVAPGIRRIELYQPLSVQSNDGLGWDDLRMQFSAASECQQDLGFQGPGSAFASLCGTGLDVGESSGYEVAGAPTGAPGALVLSIDGSSNVIFAGGTLVSFGGLVSSLPISSTPSGTFSLPVPGSQVVTDLVIQSVFIDSSLPRSLAFTNAISAPFGQ